MSIDRSIMAVLLMLAVVAISRASPGLVAQERAVLFRENFTTLENWKPFTFPKIKKHSVYSVEREGDRHILKAESSASASAIVYKDSFHVYEYPRARWRWKVSNVYVKGNARTRQGDDYPIRVYVMFEYDPDQAGTFEQMQYGLLKTLYHEYPPHSTLSYVWANTHEPETIVTSPYTDRAKVVFLEQGVKKVGTWQEESVNIPEDYQKAFGTRPPKRARIAIMNDSDNTGERSISYLEYIEVFR